VLIVLSIVSTSGDWGTGRSSGRAGREKDARARAQPDIQFPQDENPRLARTGWRPTVWDDLYISLTNSTAFSPTDAMPLTGRMKLFMSAESLVAITAVILVTARAVNVLGS
jgi:hypothetical protein